MSKTVTFGPTITYMITPRKGGARRSVSKRRLHENKENVENARANTTTDPRKQRDSKSDVSARKRNTPRRKSKGRESSTWKAQQYDKNARSERRASWLRQSTKAQGENDTKSRLEDMEERYRGAYATSGLMMTNATRNGVNINNSAAINNATKRGRLQTPRRQSQRPSPANNNQPLALSSSANRSGMTQAHKPPQQNHPILHYPQAPIPPTAATRTTRGGPPPTPTTTTGGATTTNTTSQDESACSIRCALLELGSSAGGGSSFKHLVLHLADAEVRELGEAVMHAVSLVVEQVARDEAGTP